MKKVMLRLDRRSRSPRVVLSVLLALTITSQVDAHFPWLATDADGNAAMWFGESPTDRTYPMPATVQAIELKSVTESQEQPIMTESVDGDDLVGIQSKLPVNPYAEVAGSVAYGLYHGTKLSYHVEHLPQVDPSAWPRDPRSDAAMQTVVNQTPNGGVSVTAYRDDKTLSDVEIKLINEMGDQKAAAKTDENGNVVFEASDVEAGLNAVVIGLTDSDAKGTFNGEDFGSTTDYLTATFRIPGEKPKEDSAEPSSKKPQVDPNSGASVGPTNLPDLPEELTSFGAAIAGEKLYVYGGHTGEAHSYSVDEQSNRLWCLDLSAGETGQWKNLANGPKLQGLALVPDGNDVIRIGGFTAVNELGDEHHLRSQTSVARFDYQSQSWTDLPDLPEARSSLDAAVLNNTVYVFGGWKLDGESDSSHWHQTAWSLDLSNQNANWQATAPPTFQRRATSVAAHHGKLYVIGGMRPEGGPTTQVDVYHPKTDKWSEGPAVPGSGMSGFGSSSFATGGKLYVSTMDGFVHQLSDDGQSWNTIAKSDPARFFHRMLPVGEKELLIIGGANMEIGKFTAIDALRLAGGN